MSENIIFFDGGDEDRVLRFSSESARELLSSEQSCDDQQT